MIQHNVVVLRHIWYRMLSNDLPDPDNPVLTGNLFLVVDINIFQVMRTSTLLLHYGWFFHFTCHLSLLIQITYLLIRSFPQEI